MIRLATMEDVPEILKVYAPYIEQTAVSFEYEVPSLEAFRRRFENVTAAYPWIVWEENGTILGYAYADRAFEREAYSWDADLSIYLAQDARGRGIGTRLYGCLEELLKELGYHNLYALITGENQASLRFHEHRGYQLLGCLKASGWKFGRWHDLYWYGLRLWPEEPPRGRPRAFAPSDWAFEQMKKYSL